MRDRGHDVVLAVAKNGGLVEKARKNGFIVYELNFQKSLALFTLPKLLGILKNHTIDLVNTHSSSDAWIGGIAGRLAKKKIIRTRHLSTPIRPGLNSRLLLQKTCRFCCDNLFFYHSFNLRSVGIAAIFVPVHSNWCRYCSIKNS